METENKEKNHESKHETKHEAAHISASSDKKQNENKSYTWPAISAVLAILLLISVFSNQNVNSAAGTPKSLDKQQFALNMKTFIADSLTQNTAEVTLENLTEENGLYKFSVLLDGKLAAISYATKDGALLFPQVLDVAKIEEQVKLQNETAPNEEPAQTAIKSDKPVVQLFVMSQCPYGVQAENAIKPVLDSLKNKISFELRFIANQKADGTFSSLHGQAEVDEDLRQVCAAKYSPASYMDYVVCRNADIRNSDWQTCATKSNLSVSTVKTCSEGTEGKTILAENIKLAEELGVGGSPTIKINSGAYNGQRTAAGMLSGICAAFNTAPAECSQALGASAVQTAEVPAGGCGA